MEKKVQGGGKPSLKIKETKQMDQTKGEKIKTTKKKMENFFETIENILKKEKCGQ